MAKPHIRRLSPEDHAANREIRAKLERGEYDNFEDPNPIGELTPQMIVDGYRKSRQFINLDYPGGIEQFVKDYEAGKFDE